MKKWSGSYRPGDLYRFLIPLVAFSIPVHNRLNTFILLLLLLVWLFDGTPRTRFRRFRESKVRSQTLLFSLFYIVYVAGLIFTENMAMGLFSLEVKLSVLLIPLFFATFTSDVSAKMIRRHALLGFVAGSLLAAFICLGQSLVHYFRSGDVLEFYYSNLSYYHHASYLSMYLVFAVVILLFEYFGKNKSVKPRHRFVAAIIIIYFIAMVVLLSSKAGILSVFGAALLVSAGMLITGGRLAKPLIILAGMTMVTLAFLVIFPYAINRFGQAAEAVSGEQVHTGENYDGTTGRIEIWKISAGILKDHWLTGVGTGDVQDVLNERYAWNGNTHAGEKRLNAHNQYLQTFLETGIIGFILLMGLLIFPLIRAWKHNDRIYLIFLLLFVFNMLFESMLERQSGVVFYAFFNALLFFTVPASDL